MNKRTIIIVALLAAPVIGLIVLTKKSEDSVKAGSMSTTPVSIPATDGTPQPPRPPQTLDEAKQRVKQRMDQLDKMSEADWQAEQQQKLADRQANVAKLRALLQQQREAEPAAQGQQQGQQPQYRLPDLEPKKADPGNAN
jgi:membrane protein involved in colicin uptake